MSNFGNRTTRQERANVRVERFIEAGLTALTVLIAQAVLGPWGGWGYMLSMFIGAVLFGAYAYGLSRNAEAEHGE